MSKVRMSGRLRPSLNLFPLMLTPGLAALGYTVGESLGAWLAMAAWLVLITVASFACALHALCRVVEGGPRTDSGVVKHESGDAKP